MWQRLTSAFQKAPFVLVSIGIAVFTVRCGEVKLDKNRTSVDAAPTGTLIAQGSFTAESGSALTGIAQIYLSGDGVQYIIRIQSLAAPNETGLQLTAVANGQQVYQTTLTSFQGDTNYSTGIPPTTTWNSVSIRSEPKNKSYGTAILTAQ